MQLQGMAHRPTSRLSTRLFQGQEDEAGEGLIEWKLIWAML